jgi:hypothetical protein
MTQINVLDYVGPHCNSYGKITVSASQHINALAGKTNDFGRSLIKMLDGWQDYAKSHEVRYESPIGDDYVIGVYWAELGLAIKRLLDGETGGLDCGSISHNVLALLSEQGFKNDGYSLREKE